MKLYIFTLSVIILFIGCGSDDTSKDKEVKVTTFDTVNTTTNTEVSKETKTTEPDTISKVNILREKSGLKKLSTNIILNDSALNHAKYLEINDKVGHDEISSDSGFTGENGSLRAIYSGYKSKNVSENVSVGQETEQKSLDGLMAAIYHRFGFLSFRINEIGYGMIDKSYVYNMGNTYLNTLCNSSSFEGTGEYYYDICNNKDFRIAKDIYDNAINKVIDSNPKYVIYPYPNQTDVDPVFYEETPDPLPSYGVSGYPISIEFNENDFSMDEFEIISFGLKDYYANNIELIEHNNGSTIMNSVNDFNEHFNNYQFAIFPKNRLNYNEIYNVEFSYKYKGVIDNITWSFRTKSLQNLIKYNNSSLDIALKTEYYIYLEPNDKNDLIKSYNTDCRYNNKGKLEIVSSLYDRNTLKINIKGTLVEYCDINIDDSKYVHLNIK